MGVSRRVIGDIWQDTYEMDTEFLTGSSEAPGPARVTPFSTKA
jgi:hypothetical protein